MDNKKENFIKAGLWYTIGNLLIKGISFLTLPIFTRLLSVHDFGSFNIFLAYENILTIIIALGIPGTIKTAKLEFDEEFNKYISSIISLIFAWALLVGIVGNGLAIKFFYSELWNMYTINILIFYSLATALFNILSMKYVIECDYKKNLRMSFVYTFSSVIISVVFCFVIFEQKRFLARIIGNSLPLIVITFILSISFMKKNKAVFNKRYWKYGIVLGFPLIFHSLSLVIMQQVDKLMINQYYGSEVTGIYSLGVNIMTILTIVLSSIDNSWAPWFYTNLDKRNYAELRNKNKYLCIFFMYLTIGFVFISPELVKFMGSDEYRNAIYVLIPLNISVYVNFMYMFSVNQEYYYKKTKYIALGTIFSTILDIILNLIFVPKYGFIAASYTTLASKVALFIVHWIISRRIDKECVVKLKTLISTAIIVFCSGIICLISLDNIILRYFIIIISSIIVFIKLKHFLQKE